jgi:hypothetical protein
MKNLIEYRFYCENLFFKFVKEQINISELENGLLNMENNIGMKEVEPTKEIWFKFSKDDTLCTTINNLIKDLNNPTNKEFRIVQMTDCYSLGGNELEIYFS